MKKLLANVAKKAAAFADDVASYNTEQGAKTASASHSTPPVAPGSPQHATNTGAPDPVLEHLLRNVRSKHVRQHFFKTPASEYTLRKQVTVQAATFNVAGKKPPPGLRLSDWLGSEALPGGWPKAADGNTDGAGAGAAKGAGGSDGPDIVAVGFQEIVPLNAGNVMGVWASDNTQAWDRCLAAHLNGEEWATQRYGPSGPAPAGQAAAAAAAGAPDAAALLDARWQGGGGATGAGAEQQGDGRYMQVASKQLVGVYLSVWVRASLLHAVHGVQVTTVATGFGGYLGNKGAVAARLRVYDSTLAIVAAHLTAGDVEGDELKRNADVAEVLRRAAFATAPDGGGAVPMTSPMAALVSASLGPGHWPPGASSLTDHDLLLWVGDLNYRLAPSVISDADARAAIRAGRLAPLLAADQLGREMAAGRVFRGWHEGRITFPPTYKYKVGTHMYQGDESSTASLAGLASGSSSTGQSPAAALAAGAGAEEDPSVAGGAEAAEGKKRRTPAWCDRVLWGCRREVAGAGGGGHGGAARLQQLGYWRSEQITISDHRPVAAAFAAEVVSYDRRRIEALLEGALRAVDMMQQSLRPKVTVEPVVVEAGDVALGLPVALPPLRLCNTGTVEALFHFVPPPSGKAGSGKFGLDDETPPLPPWLTAQPAEGVLQPGETCEVQLTVLVDGGPDGPAAGLQGPGAGAGASPLDSIVILRIEDSGDKFVTISGRYHPSFLGVPLEALAALGPSPALAADLAEAQAAQLGLGQLPAAAASQGATEGVPKEVAALASALTADPQALATPGLFVDSCCHVLGRPAAGGQGQGQPTSRDEQQELLRRLAKLRLALDAAGGVPSGTPPHEAAAVLLLWCAQLPQPLVPQGAADAAAAVPPASAADAATLLHSRCSAAQLAALRCVLRVLHAAAAAAAGGLEAAAAALGAVAAAWVLPPLPPGADGDAAANRAALFAVLLQEPSVL